MARKSKPQRAPLRRLAQVKVRLPEPLRRDLERAAAASGHSMNVEIVRRLFGSFTQELADKTSKLIATALLKELDEATLAEIVSKYLRDRGERNVVVGAASRRIPK
jgi:Arc-like DNA binding dprotein